MKPIYFQESTLAVSREILFFSDAELCHIFQTKEYEVKIKELWYFWGSFQENLFPCKGKKTTWDSAVLSLRNLDLRKGKQKTQKSHPGPEPQEGSAMHWSGPSIMITCTHIVFSGFCALCKQRCHGEDSTDNIAYEAGSISSSNERGKPAVLNIIPWIVRVCCYQYPKLAF